MLVLASGKLVILLLSPVTYTFGEPGVDESTARDSESSVPVPPRNVA